MMEKCDVVIDCFRPGKLERIGLGPKDFSSNRLIFARVSGFGQTGPLREYVNKYIKKFSIFIIKLNHNIIFNFKLKYAQGRTWYQLFVV